MHYLRQMNTAPSTRLLVLSDLHAHSTESSADGAVSLSFHGSATGVSRMFDGLEATLLREGITGIDAVICAGDLSEQCDESALPLVWDRLCRLADKLGAELVATAGNHDMLRKGGPAPQLLLTLEPPFPMRDENERMRYFSYHFARAEINGHSIFSLNTASLTGRKDENGKDEHEHGSIEKITIDKIKESLSQAPARGTRVLVMHHHPVQLPSIDLKEDSRARNVERLLELLEHDGSWLVIHGHKHRPWIHYSYGGGGSPVLFSAGSFAAPLDGVLAQSTKNQFYVLDLLPDADAHELQLGPAGRFRAWSHSPHEEEAWVKSGATDGIPARGGFGWRADPSRVARLIADYIVLHSRDQTWDDLLAHEPRLAYLTPQDWAQIDRKLAGINPDLRIEREAHGALVKIEYRERAQS